MSNIQSDEQGWLSMIGKVGRPGAQYFPVGTVDQDDEPTTEAQRINRALVQGYRDNGGKPLSPEAAQVIKDQFAKADQQITEEQVPDPAYEVGFEEGWEKGVARGKSYAKSEIGNLMKPFRDFINVNDDDTLGNPLSDTWVVATATGSWGIPAAITLGDIRRLAGIAEADIASKANEKFGQAISPDPAPATDRTPAELHFDTIVKERRIQGWQTYGKGLDHTDARYDYNREALCEALDGWQYTATENLQLLEWIARMEAEVDRLNGVVVAVTKAQGSYIEALRSRDIALANQDQRIMHLRARLLSHEGYFGNDIDAPATNEQLTKLVGESYSPFVEVVDPPVVAEALRG